MGMHRPMPSHATQPLNIGFGIGFMAALVVPLGNAQWLSYKKELPTCLRQVCVYLFVYVRSCVVPLGSRRRGSWLPYICLSSCHCSFLLCDPLMGFHHNMMFSYYPQIFWPNFFIDLACNGRPTINGFLVECGSKFHEGS
jgi:hypothetical protein